MKKQIFIACLFIQVSAVAVGQPFNNYSPKHGLILQSTVFGFNSYFKHGDYKQFLDNQKLNADLGYFRRVHDGPFLQLFLIGSAGKNTIEFNRWNMNLQTNTYTVMHFIRPSLSGKIEFNMGKKTKLFTTAGYGHNFNIKYQVVDQTGAEVLNENLTSFGQLRWSSGLRFILNHKWSFECGFGGDLPLGKKLTVDNREMKLITNNLVSGVAFRFN